MRLIERLSTQRLRDAESHRRELTRVTRVLTGLVVFSAMALAQTPPPAAPAQAAATPAAPADAAATSPVPSSEPVFT
jgi:hypothetical protein